MQTQSPQVHRHALRTASIALGLFLTLLGIAVFGGLLNPAAPEPATPISPPRIDVPNASGSATERTVFAGGCFWGVQAVFQHTLGVTSAVSGYAGGTLSAPSYEQVSSGGMGHAETVEITFDPKQILRPPVTDLFFGGARPDAIEPAGPR